MSLIVVIVFIGVICYSGSCFNNYFKTFEVIDAYIFFTFRKILSFISSFLVFDMVFTFLVRPYLKRSELSSMKP